MILLTPFFTDLEQFSFAEEEELIEKNVMKLLLPNIVPLDTASNKKDNL